MGNQLAASLYLHKDREGCKKDMTCILQIQSIGCYQLNKIKVLSIKVCITIEISIASHALMTKYLHMSNSIRLISLFFNTFSGQNLVRVLRYY